MPGHGSFIWYELITTDTDAAGQYYASVLGWSVAEFGGGGPPYHIFSAPDGSVGGMMALPPAAAAAGMRPGWLGYIAVDDVDRAIADIVGAGGTVRMPATDLPGVGRIGMVADPQGVPFYVMRGAGEQPSRAYDPVLAGHCSWNELGATDPVAALDFYSGQFGWTGGDSMPMGEAGEYRFFHHAGERIGGMMRRQPPMWTFYMRVIDIDAAASRATAGGGTVMHGPIEVPGGDHVIVATDPQGALFALVGQRVASAA